MNSKKSAIDALLDIAGNAETAAIEQKNDVTKSELADAVQRLDIKIKQEDLEGKKQDREQRREFAYKIYKLIVGYLIVVLAFVGFSRLIGIDNSVLITLLGTTTANVISLFAFVAKYLFHPKE